jgi:hypothetical protein
MDIKRSSLEIYLLNSDESARIVITDNNFIDIIDMIIEKSAKKMDGSYINIDCEVTM